MPCTIYTTVFAASATKGAAISIRPKRPASARHWAAYSVIAANKGPPIRAFNHNEIGTVGRLQVAMVSTEYARDTIVTNTTPIAAINASSSRCNHTRGLTENEYSQYRPLHLPYCVGGGFRSVADIRRMIAAGADKVSVNSAAVDNPQLISDAAAAFGTQAILCAIDAKQVAGNPNKWEVYVHGGRTATGIDTVEWAAEAARRGAGEILLTSMDRDGSKDGFDCALTRAVARAVDIPVIASGGVGKLEHFAEGIIDGEADAVLAASVFHFGEFTVTQVKEYMRSQGIPVRL